MQWRWGSYLWPANCVEYRTRKQTLRNGAGVPYSQQCGITLNGNLFGNSQAEIAVQIALMETAVKIPYRDLALIRDDGGVALALWNSTSTTGVVNTEGPSWDGGGANFSTFIGFSGLTFEAEYPLPAGAANILIAFTESVRRSGGLPKVAWLTPSTGPVIRQRVSDASPYRLTQRGSAVGFLNYPVVPPPLWPAALEDEDVEYETPELHGTQFRNFKVNWSYEFGSGTALVGTTPNQWPI